VPHAPPPRRAPPRFRLARLGALAPSRPRRRQQRWRIGDGLPGSCLIEVEPRQPRTPGGNARQERLVGLYDDDGLAPFGGTAAHGALMEQSGREQPQETATRQTVKAARILASCHPHLQQGYGGRTAVSSRHDRRSADAVTPDHPRADRAAPVWTEAAARDRPIARARHAQLPRMAERSRIVRRYGARLRRRALATALRVAG